MVEPLNFSADLPFKTYLSFTFCWIAHCAFHESLKKNISPCPFSFPLEALHLLRKYLWSVHYESCYESLLSAKKVGVCSNLRGQLAMEMMTADSNRVVGSELEQAKLWTNKSLCHCFYRQWRVNTFHNQMCTCPTYADTDSFLLRVCICIQWI